MELRQGTLQIVPHVAPNGVGPDLDSLQQAGEMAVLGSELAVLHRHPFFQSFRGTDLQDLLHRERPCRIFQPAEPIGLQGDPVTDILFLVSGRARAHLNATPASPQAIVLDLLSPGSTVGLLSLVDKGPHSATVTAITQVKALALDPERLQVEMDLHPDWYRTLAEIAAQRLRNSATWLQALLG